MLDKIKCIEIPIQIDDRKSKTIEISIAGILKLKNSQVEASLGDFGVVHPRSTRVRLVIMAILNDEMHKDIVIQNICDTIACSELICIYLCDLLLFSCLPDQISSEPVISKISLEEGTVNGGQELWIIGKLPPGV